MITINQMKNKVKSAMSPRRFMHTIGVMETAEKLARIYGDEELAERAKIAGLLHDIVKEIPPERRDKLCKKYNVCQDEFFQSAPELIHPHLGAEVAKYECGVKDEEILNAIRYHTSGRAEMTVLEKITYIADYIEPNRTDFIGLEEGRELAETDLDKAMEFMLGTILEYIGGQGKVPDPVSLKAYSYYTEINKNK